MNKEVFSDNDMKHIKEVFRKESKDSLRTYAAIFIMASYVVSTRSKIDLLLRLAYIFFIFVPLLAFAFFLTNRSILLDMYKREKIVTSAIVNIVSLFGVLSDAHVQLLLPSGAIMNFSMHHDQAASLASGDDVSVAFAPRSKVLFKINKV
ncbi:MAG: hypothetical protein IT274_03455 [Chitinophagales bacterium]|nr:hypothetical protein [Chitinophagales bacterium]